MERQHYGVRRVSQWRGWWCRISVVVCVSRAPAFGFWLAVRLRQGAWAGTSTCGPTSQYQRYGYMFGLGYYEYVPAAPVQVVLGSTTTGTHRHTQAHTHTHLRGTHTNTNTHSAESLMLICTHRQAGQKPCAQSAHTFE